ncbi:multiheme c-type cytochrome [Sphingosinicella sp. LHD-64]|nr:multiheme c-type cytochrome [Sphingosinicella sp. LHD-64]MDQ8755381.1 multiheme c-type cytochrome [Sphingosinicella sp. LHD-64]
MAVGLGAAGILAALLLVLFHPQGAEATLQDQTSGATFVGVATCGGSTCHGRSEADGPVVRQDEIMLWQDPSSAAGAHSRAYAVLQDPRSQVIAQRLGIGEATSAPMCLGCHATPAGQRGTRFQLSDGVGCESCHGAASGWLSSHYAVGGTHANNVARGLIPLENPRVRAGVCLDCHFGSADEGQFVTHRIMAAGHPRISFELDLFTTLQAHHQEDDDYRTRKGRADAVRTWAVGQAMALERSLSLFASQRRGMEGMFPEFYFFDCHSCHRQISDDVNYRPTAVANPGRPIPSGMPPYNDENMIMLAAAARVMAPGLAQQFERDSRAFHQAIARERSSAVVAAGRLRQTAQAMVEAFTSANVTRQTTFAIIDSITSDAINPRFTDYAGSVQAVMATDTLLSSLVNQGEVSEATANTIRADINGAYRAVRDPNAYSPGDFRASLGRAAAAIRRLR